MKLPQLSRRSMFRRTLLLLAGFTLLLQVILYALSFRLNVWPLLQVSSEDLVELLVLSVNTIESAQPERRAALRAQIALQHDLSLAEATGPLPGQPSLLPYALALRNLLSKRFDHDLQVTVQDDIYYADIPVDGHMLRFSFPHSRIGTNPLLTLALTLVLTLLLSIGAALVVAYKLTCPIRDLSQAAVQVGQGSAPRLQVQSSVQELDELVTTFNTMAQQVHTLINARTTLLAGISHDLRSPLTRARLAVDLAREGIEPVALDDIDRYLAQMEILLVEFLDFSRGASNVPAQSIDLRDALNNICIDYCSDEPTVHLLGDAVPTHVDLMPFDRVLRNLVSNARRYGGGQPVEIRCADAGNKIIIEVMDRGPGIAPTDRIRIFEPFVRLETSRNRATGGSGLGLAIVRDICRTQGWSIELADREGGGLIARLTIPAKALSLTTV